MPIGLAVSLIWLEIGIASGRRSVMFLASATPFGLVLVALMGHRYEAVYQHFLTLFVHTLGASPAFLSLLAATLFLVYAARRGAPLAWELISLSMIALGLVAPTTVEVFDLVAPRWPPLAAAGLVLGTVAWRRDDCVRAFMAAGLLAAAATCCYAVFFPHAKLGPVWIQLTLLALLTVAAPFDAPLAILIRACGVPVLLVLGVAMAIGHTPISRAVPAELAPGYPVLIAAVACVYAFLVRNEGYLVSAFVSFVAWFGGSGWHIYAQLRKAAAGLDQIVWGLIFFSVAMAISLEKAGIRARLLARPAVKCREFWQGPEWRLCRAAKSKS